MTNHPPKGAAMTSETKATFTPGPLHAVKGDTLNPARSWGVVKYLTREQHIEIDGDDFDESNYPYRSEVVAEVCDGPTAEADAALFAAAPELLAFYLEASELRRQWQSDDENDTIDSIDYMDGLDAVFQKYEAAILAATGGAQ